MTKKTIQFNRRHMLALGAARDRLAVRAVARRLRGDARGDQGARQGVDRDPGRQSALGFVNSTGKQEGLDADLSELFAKSSASPPNSRRWPSPIASRR